MKEYLLGVATLPALIVLAWLALRVVLLCVPRPEWESCLCAADVEAPGEGAPSGSGLYPGGTSWVGRRWRWIGHRRSLRHRAWLRSSVQTRVWARDFSARNKRRLGVH